MCVAGGGARVPRPGDCRHAGAKGTARRRVLCTGSRCLGRWALLPAASPGGPAWPTPFPPPPGPSQFLRGQRTSGLLVFTAMSTGPTLMPQKRPEWGQFLGEPQPPPRTPGPGGQGNCREPHPGPSTRQAPGAPGGGACTRAACVGGTQCRVGVASQGECGLGALCPGDLQRVSAC